jgi:type I restriction enzyme S subunit
MIEIYNLIDKLCPDGVPFEPLWKLTTWDKRFNAVDNFKQPKVKNYKYFLAGDLRPLIREKGDVKLLTTNLSDLWTFSDLVGEFVSKGEIVGIPWGGNVVIHYYKGKFITADNRIAVVNDTDELSTKYLYYFLLSQLKLIETFYKGAGIKHPTMSRVLDLKIPLPPIKIQKEIVAVLDKFVELESELDAELQARKKQIEYYARYMNETFPSEKITKLPLSKLAEIGTGSRNTQDAKSNGKYPFFVRSQTPMALDEYEFDETAILTAGDGVGVGKVFHFIEGKYALHQRAYRLKVTSDDLLPKYLFYYFKNNFGKYLKTAAFHASVTSLRRPMFENFEVSFPSKKSQEIIVDFLDKIESYLGNDEIGLQAEIKARHKQYEYYREKLLTFKELDLA